HFINPATSQVEPPIVGSSYISYNASAGGNRSARKFLRFGIETDERIGLHSRFAVPDRSMWGNRDAVWIGTRAARRRPLLKFLHRWVEVTEITAFIVCVIERVIRRDRNPPRAGAE